MFASEPENIYCAVPGCTTEQKTNLDWYVIPGSVSFANKNNNLIFENKKFAWLEKLNIKDIKQHEDIYLCPLHFCDENGQNLNSTSSASNTVPVEEDSVIKKQIFKEKIQLKHTEEPTKQISAIHCVVPKCPSGLKGYPSTKWYILPGFRRTKPTIKNSAYDREEETLYSKLNIPKVELGKSIQICSKHFHRTGSKELNLSSMSQSEGIEEILQKKVIYTQTKPEGVLKNIEGMKINFNRTQLQVNDSGLLLSKKEGNDGKIHLKNWSDKLGMAHIQPLQDKLKRIPIFKQSRVVIPKSMQKTHTLCKGLSNVGVNNITANRSKIISNNIETVRSISNERPKNDKAVQLKYCSMEGNVYHITIDEGDHKIKEEIPDEPPPPKEKLEFVNVHDVINPTYIDKETEEKQNVGKIRVVNSELLYHRKLNENQKQFNETKDVSTQTYFVDGFQEITDFIRKKILTFKFYSDGDDFIINNCALYFQPSNQLGRTPSIVHVNRHIVNCTNIQLMEDLNRCTWRRTETDKAAGRSSRVYAPINGFHEVKKNAIPNSLPDKIIIKSPQVETPQNLLRDAGVQKKIPASSNAKNFPRVTLSTNIIKAAVTLPPKVKVLKSDDIKDEKLKRGLTNVLKNWTTRNNHLPSINFRPDASDDVIQSENQSAPSNNLIEIKIEDDDVIVIPDEPTVQLEEDLGAIQVGIGTNAANIAKVREKIEIRKEISSLRRSGRSKQKINFAAMIRAHEQNRGIKDLKRDSKLGKKRIINTKTKIIGEMNKKRKSTVEEIPAQPVNKKGKFDEIIGELEKFLELTLEEPSEDDASVLTFGDSFNCAYCLSPITPNSTHEKCLEILQKEGRLLDQINKNEGKADAKPPPKPNCPITAAKPSTCDVKNKALPIGRDQDDDIMKTDKERESTRPETKITVTTEDHLEASLKEKKDRRKKRDLCKIKMKNRANIRSVAKSKSDVHEQHKLPDVKKSSEVDEEADKIESVEISENLEGTQSNTNVGATTICLSCNRSIDNRGLNNHSKFCCQRRSRKKNATGGTPKTICKKCNRCFDTRGLVSHFRSCKFRECEHCDEKFDHLDALKDHLLKLEGCLLCEKCEVVFLRSNLHNHRKKCKFMDKRIVAAAIDLSYMSSNAHRICKRCMTSFESFRKFMKHVYTRHRNQGIKLKMKTKYKILKKYTRNWMMVSQYKCKFCGKSSATMKQRVDHYKKCLKIIVENCAVKTELGTYIKAEVIM